MALTLAGVQPVALAQSGSVEDRLARVERMLNNNTLLQMLDELQAMRSDMRALRGDMELQAHQAGQIKAQNKAQYLDLDERLKRLEAQLFAGVGPGGSGVEGLSPSDGGVSEPFNSTGGGTDNGLGTGDPSGGDGIYEAAFAQLKAGDYDGAAAGFQAYVRDHPDGRYGANAYYWLGETHYVEQRFTKALETFGQVMTLYPGSGKAADAMLKSGYILQEQGQRDRAVQMLNDVVNLHPGSRAAELARDRLARLGN